MKIQFSEGAVRIRLTREAFDALRAGEVQRLPLPLAGDPGVILAAGPAFQAVARAGGLQVTWDRASLDDLAERLPAREGLAAEACPAGRPLRIVLEVDVRAGRGSRTPPAGVR